MINDDMKTRESLSVFDEKGTEMADALMAGFLKIKEIPIEGHSKDKRVKAISRDNEIISIELDPSCASLSDKEKCLLIMEAVNNAYQLTELCIERCYSIIEEQKLEEVIDLVVKPQLNQLKFKKFNSALRQ